MRGAGLDAVEERPEDARARRGPDGDGRLRLVDEHEGALVADGEGDAARGLADGVGRPHGPAVLGVDHEVAVLLRDERVASGVRDRGLLRAEVGVAVVVFSKFFGPLSP